ncbi:MAG: hypothetical protein Q9193_004188 [Seirophora villosa]
MTMKPKVIISQSDPTLAAAPWKGSMPGGAPLGATPVPVGLAVTIPPLSDTPPLEPGIGYGAMAVETIKGGSVVVNGAGAALVEGTDELTKGETTGEGMTITGNDVTTAASEELVVDGVLSAGGVDSPSARVEVTVACPTVWVRVMVEVEDKVVVGSSPGASASSAASDARGRARRAEVSKRRMVVAEAQSAHTQIMKMKQRSSVSPTVNSEEYL